MHKYRILEPEGLVSGPRGLFFCLSIISGYGFRRVRPRPEEGIFIEFYLEREFSPEDLEELEGAGYRVEKIPEKGPEQPF